jgi:S1-C subfamily serine protease
MGQFSGVFRKGDVMSEMNSFLLTSLPATRGSSGSPVFNQYGFLVGMVTEIVPVLRESGLYSGDHFAEYVITKCRTFH